MGGLDRSAALAGGILMTRHARVITLGGGWRRGLTLWSDGVGSLLSAGRAMYEEMDDYSRPAPFEWPSQHTDDLEWQLVADCFIHLQTDRDIASSEYRTVLDEIRPFLAPSWLTDLTADPVMIRTRDGRERTWAEFWEAASGWLKSKIEPGELGDYLRDASDEQAQLRLTTYFIHESDWLRLEDIAQRALISADHTLLTAKVGRTEVVLNHLQVALESMLHDMVWSRAKRWAQRPPRDVDTGKVDFSNLRRATQIVSDEQQKSEIRELIRMEEASSGPRPGLNSYLKLLNHGAASPLWRAMAKVDRDWLTHDLPRFLRDRLRPSRNDEQHPERAEYPIGLGDGVYQAVLGIGGTGVVPRLVECGRQLSEIVDSQA